MSGCLQAFIKQDKSLKKNNLLPTPVETHPSMNPPHMLVSNLKESCMIYFQYGAFFLVMRYPSQ